MLQRCAVDMRLSAFIARGPHDLVHNVARITGTQFLLEINPNEVDQVMRYAGFVFHSIVTRYAAKDFAKLVV